MNYYVSKIKTLMVSSGLWALILGLGLMFGSGLTANVYAEGLSDLKPVTEIDAELAGKSDENILADDGLKLKLMQRTFVNRVGYDKLKGFVNGNDEHAEMLEWLYENAGHLEKYLLGGTPEGGEGQYIRSLGVLSDLYKEFAGDLGDEKNGKTFETMMMAISLAYGSDVNGWQTAVLKDHPYITDVRTPSNHVERYKVLRQLFTDPITYDLVTTDFNNKIFADLEVEEMRWVVNNRISDKEIPWLNWYTQKVKKGETGYSKDGLNFMGPYTYINYDGGFKWFYEDPEYYVKDSKYCALDVLGNASKYRTDGYLRGDNCNTKYGLDHFGLETGPGQPLRLWTIWEEDGVCGSVAGVGTNIQMAYGIPSSLVSQPGHAAYFQSAEPKNFGGQMLREWSINNNCGNWSNSYKGERMPLNWGTRVKDGWSDWNNASYLLVAQRALDNYDKMQKSFPYVWLAEMRTDDWQKIAAYEKAIKEMDYNIDAWYALTQIANRHQAKEVAGEIAVMQVANDELSLSEEDYYKFAVKIMEHLEEFPLPMYDLLKQIMNNVGKWQVAYVKKLDATLDRLVGLDAKNGPYFQTQAAIDIANYILGRTGDTDIAEFSFDGEDAMMLKLKNGPLAAKSPFEYSYETDLKDYEDGQMVDDESHWHAAEQDQVEVDLTEHKKEIDEKKDILVHLKGTPRLKENIFVVNIDEGKTDEVYVNEKEWKIVGADERIAEWVELKEDASMEEQMNFFDKLFKDDPNDQLDWKKFTEKEPVVDEKSNENQFYGIYVRYGYSGTNTPSEPRLINHGDKPNPTPTSEYISTDKQMVTSSYAIMNEDKVDEGLPKLLDGNKRSYWQNNPKDEHKYLIYTFEEPVHLNKIEYVMGTDQGTWWGHIDEAQIEVSLDGENYKVLDDKVKWDWASGKSVYPYDLPEEEYVKYVKITPMKMYNNNSNVRVAMFNFYQDTTAKTDLKDLEELVEFTAPEYTYDGEEKKPEIVLKDYDGTTLQPGEDYEVEYENNVEPGTGTVRVVGKGKYEGSLAREFAIAPGGTKPGGTESGGSEPGGSESGSDGENTPGDSGTTGSESTGSGTEGSEQNGNDSGVNSGEVSSGNVNSREVEENNVIPGSPDTGGNFWGDSGVTVSVSAIVVAVFGAGVGYGLLRKHRK